MPGLKEKYQNLGYKKIRKLFLKNQQKAEIILKYMMVTLSDKDLNKIFCLYPNIDYTVYNTDYFFKVIKITNIIRNRKKLNIKFKDWIVNHGFKHSNKYDLLIKEIFKE